MIPDTDEAREKLLSNIEAFGKTVGSPFNTSEVLSTLIVLINQYIAEDRAQGQAPVAIVENALSGTTSNPMKRVKILNYDGMMACDKLYTHAQPVAEIQAETLEKSPQR